MRYQPLKERLLQKSVVDPERGCRVFQGYTIEGGYGLIGNERGRNPKLVLAHRASYEEEYGPVPAGLDVLHTCDNPPCIEPSHLFLGTTAENTADMSAKGRAAGKHGKRHVELLAQDRVDVRRALADGETVAGLARKYGVDRKTIRNVRSET